MLTAQDNATLTQVGPGTPMGEYFRRNWLPAFLSKELAEPDCPPLRTRILGEDLVAFRDTSGAIGIIDAFCPHRRAHMFSGRNEECGLRCVYHGHKFDRHGNCVDFPAAPEGSNIQKRSGIKAYPVLEIAGIVWVYMGPAELMPERPLDLPFTRRPAEDLAVMRYLVQCNWLQNMEGDIDAEHIPFLHSFLDKRNFANAWKEDGLGSDQRPETTIVDTEYGFAAGTRWRKSSGEYNWRVNQVILPSFMLIPFPGEHMGESAAVVPIDDRHCMVFLVWPVERMPMVPGPDGEMVRMETFLPLEQGTFGFDDGLAIDIPIPVYGKHNNYGIDRERQRTFNFSGLPTLKTEDQAIAETMGYVVDRTKEQLDFTDKPIIALRRRLLEAAKGLEQSDAMGPRQPNLRDVVPCDVDTATSTLPELLAEVTPATLAAGGGGS